MVKSVTSIPPAVEERYQNTPSQPEEITERDNSMFTALAGYAGIPNLTAQEQRFVIFFAKGMVANAAARAAGYKGQYAGSSLLRKPSVQRALEVITHNALSEIRITRTQLTEMLLDSHSHAANASEEIMAIRELGKLHGSYAPTEKKVSMDIEARVTSTKHLERLSDSDLNKIAGEEIVLEPGDYEETD